MRHRLRRWMAVLGAVGGLCGLGFACGGSDRPPSGRARQARADVLRQLFSSRENMPDPQALQAQRRDLQAEVDPNGMAPPDPSPSNPPEASTTGTVEWVGDDELLIRDTGGVERDLRVQGDTRFRQGERSVSRRMVEKGADVRVGYDLAQGEWVAREVELLRKPVRSLAEETVDEQGVTQPVPK